MLDADELAAQFDAVKRLGQNNFSDAGVFIEKYIERARHLEVQVFGDGEGNALALGVRDCSVQRRNQKVLEETPAPSLPDGMSRALCDAALRLAKAVNYRSAGTVEFVYDSGAERVLFPRSEYAPASRARRDRAGVGRRSRALDDRASGRHAGAAR